MLLPILGSLTLAHADTLVVLRGSAERWQDPAIGTVYRQGGLMGGVGVHVDVFGPVGVDIDVAYKRLEDDSETQTFDIVPVTFMGTFTFPAPDAPLDPFVGLGLAFTSFAERGATDPTTGLRVVQGLRPAVELRAGIRFDLGLVQPSLTGTQPIKGVDVEIFGARRQTLPSETGFDLAAWRGVVGLALRL